MYRFFASLAAGLEEAGKRGQRPPGLHETTPCRRSRRPYAAEPDQRWGIATSKQLSATWSGDCCSNHTAAAALGYSTGLAAAAAAAAASRGQEPGGILVEREARRRIRLCEQCCGATVREHVCRSGPAAQFPWGPAPGAQRHSGLHQVLGEHSQVRDVSVGYAVEPEDLCAYDWLDALPTLLR